MNTTCSVMRKNTLSFTITAYLLTAVFAVFCIVPFIMLVSGSFTSEKAIAIHGFSLIPYEFSLNAYLMILKNPLVILNAYGVTILVTTVGTLLSLLVTSMAAYAMQRKDFNSRHFFSFMFYFTTIFSGGLVPWYILIVRYLHLKDTLLVLILPSLVNVFYLIIIRTFMSSIPDAIIESAKIDGAGEFTIFCMLILPLSKPVLAAIGMFIALNYWNDWFLAMLFIESDRLIPLQLFLYNILGKIDFLKNVMRGGNMSHLNLGEMPQESFKLAMTVVTTGPILLLYPYIQKYFIKGIMVGAVKG